MSADPPDLLLEAVSAQRVLTPFLAAGADPIALTRAFRPSPDDYGKVFRAELVAGLRSIYDGIWETQPAITRKPGQNVLLVHACVAEGFVMGSVMMEAFPGGYAGLDEDLVPGRVWACWKFVEPGKRLGMAWDGLVHLDGRWVWFPRAWAFVRKLKTA